jgi:hypothetical protein
MTEQECLDLMVAPGTRRAGKYREGVIQIHITRACDKSCFACTQGSNLSGKVEFMSPEHFEQAVRSLGFTGRMIDVTTSADGDRKKYIVEPGAYFGVVGVFGGNPALSPHFAEYCDILRRLVPFEQRGIWSNNPMTLSKAQEMAKTFDPSVSNLNVHLDQDAYRLFKLGWPQCSPVGLTQDSRHSPVHLAMKDVLWKKCHCVIPDPVGTALTGLGMELCLSDCPDCHGHGEVADESRMWELISGCDINQHWSAMVGMFRGGLRAWFCEVAGAQSMLHQHDPDYPDTGCDPTIYHEFRYDVNDRKLAYGPHSDLVQEMSDPGEAIIDCDMYHIPWWQLGMYAFRSQVRKHCFECGVPLRGYGELSQAPAGFEQTSATHEGVFRPKRKDRKVEVVTNIVQLGVGRIQKVNHYLQNARV